MSHLWLSLSLSVHALCFVCILGLWRADCAFSARGRGPVLNRLCGSPVMSRADSGVIKRFHILSPLSVDQGNTGISCGSHKNIVAFCNKGHQRERWFLVACTDRLSGLECNRRKCINATADNMTFTVLAQMLMFSAEKSFSLIRPLVF